MVDGVIHLGHPLRLDRQAALALLRELGRDSAGMADLRRLLAEELGRASLQTIGDEQVIMLLAERVAAGSLTVALLRRPPLGAPPESQEAADAAEEQPTADSPECAESAPAEEPERTETGPAEEPAQEAAITDLRWSAERVEVGAKVQAMFRYTGLKPGPVTVRIFECDADEGRTEVAVCETEVKTESGQHQVIWSRSEARARADLAEDQEAGDTGPVEYRFKVEADGVKSDDESGPLLLTSTVIVKLVSSEDQAPAPDGIEVVLFDAAGQQHRSASKDGEARFPGVPVGPIRVVIGGSGGGAGS